jgi:hypothetical protein
MRKVKVGRYIQREAVGKCTKNKKKLARRINAEREPIKLPVRRFREIESLGKSHPVENLM